MIDSLPCQKVNRLSADIEGEATEFAFGLKTETIYCYEPDKLSTHACLSHINRKLIVGEIKADSQLALECIMIFIFL